MTRIISILLMFLCVSCGADLGGKAELTAEDKMERKELFDDSRKFRRLIKDLELPYFGGMYLQHEPEYRMVINITNMKYKNEVLGYIDDKRIESFVKIKKVELSISELKLLRQEAEEKLRYEGIEFESGTDIIKNRIDINIINKKGKDYFKNNNHIKIEIVKEFSRLTIGKVRGGISVSDCTTGFSVYETGGQKRKGFITAAHCNDRSSYQGKGTNLIGQSFGDKYDVQFMTVTGFEVRPEINRCRLQNCFIQITGKTEVRYQEIGEEVCKFGRTTEYTCGKIIKTDARLNLPETGVTFSNTFVVVNNNFTHMSQPGDSGGPVINENGNSAYGIVVASRGGGTYDKLIYMPIDYIGMGNPGSLEIMIK